MNTIGLCMIVKNEEKVIVRCLNSVKNLIDYVCIQDTGSTDNTVQIIYNWLKENNIPGEVNSEPWVDFAYNRSKALKTIREKSFIDYVLTLDADEIFTYENNFDANAFKNNLISDLYYVVCKYGGIEYARVNIMRNCKPFFYKGVLHEFVECEIPFIKSTAKGLYNVPLQDSARNQNTEKYKHDAEILEDIITVEKEPYMLCRYIFYLAQSYRDCCENGKAIYWYQKRADQGGWDQEVYWSLYQIGRLKEIMGYPEDDIVQSYMRAYEKCPTRIEALHNTIKFCRTHGRDHQAYIIGKYAKSLPVNKEGLFVESWMWDYGLDDEFSIACYWTGHYKEGLQLCEQLLNKIPEDQKQRVLQNINFFKLKLNST